MNAHSATPLRDPTTDTLRLEQSRTAWVPSGTAIEIHGRTITSGMIYVGSHMAGLHPMMPIEPAAIDPKSKISSNSFVRPRFGYWESPSYSRISPTERAAYLDWLEAGRPENATVQFLLLFYYGLERRLLFDARHDAAARAETPALLAELDRLMQEAQSHEHAQFRPAMVDLPIAARAVQPGFDPAELDPPRPARFDPDLPLALRLALGWYAAKGQPLPARWALNWAMCSPDMQRSTIERRCPEEFARFFASEYRRVFGEGIELAPDHGHGVIAIPALSPSFQQTIWPAHHPLPDVGSITPRYGKLVSLIEATAAALEPFARIASRSTGPAPLFAYASLPEAMDPLHDHPRLAPLATRLASMLGNDSVVLVEKSQLFDGFGISEKLSPKDSAGLSRLVARLGYGIAPDPASMRTSFQQAECIGLYRLESRPHISGTERDNPWHLALLSGWSSIGATEAPLTPRTGVAAADAIARIAELQPSELGRLRAHALWLSRHPANLGEVRRRFATVPRLDAGEAGRLLVMLASLEIPITPSRIEVLQKIYTMLGLDAGELHTDLHQVATRSRTPEQIIASDQITGFGIPAPPDPHAVVLDSAQIARVREQTDSITTLMETVFERQLTPGSASASSTPERSHANDDPHTRLLRFLLQRSHWSMTEVSELAASVGLMANGAIETINDRAAALNLGPVLDCNGEICDCDPSIAKELLAHG